MKTKKPALLICLLLTPLVVWGQFYTNGTDPARTQWNQIEAGKYSIIFPREIDSLARRYAFLLEKATPFVMAPLRAKTPSIPVVLHPYNMYSNGMVVWTPKRMELYTTPPGSSYAEKWEKQLVLHETRHVAQMSKLSQNFFRFAQFFIGQQSQGISAGGYVTKWMLEGDAVLSETEHSFSGRGREAAFLMPYRAYLSEGISFSWDIWRFGSYKYFTPNQYAFGYYLLSAMRFDNRTDFFSDIFDMVTKRPYMPFINPIAFRKAVGLSRTQSWESSTTLMRSLWEEQSLMNGDTTPFQTLIDPVSSPISGSKTKNLSKKPTSQYANYESITLLSSGSIFSIYHNLDRASSLVQVLSNGTKRHRKYVGYVSSDLIAGENKLFWTEIIPHVRWEQESYSLLRSYDTKSKRINSLSTKSRYLFPSISPSAQIIAVVHASLSGESELHLLTAAEGTLIASYPAPDKGHLQSSAWASDSLLYAVVLTDSGLGVYALDMTRSIWSQIVPPQHQNISRLQYHDGLLWFGSDLNGTDNIYVLDPHTSPAQLFVMTNANYGAFGPFPSKNTLYYTNYTYAGLRPVFTPIDNLQWKRAQFDHPYESPIAKTLSQQVHFRLDTVAVPETLPYTSRPYQKALHLFRIHSWAPVYYNAMDNIASLSMEELYHTVSPGAMLFSQNTLSTAEVQMGYAYRNGFHLGSLKYIYSGWYPVIELSADINDRYAYSNKLNLGENNRLETKRDTLNNSSLRGSLNIYVPFNFRSKGWVRGFIPRLYLSYRNDKYYVPNSEKYHYYSSTQVGSNYYQYRTMTPNNLFPRWGFGLSTQFAFSPSLQELFGSELYMSAYGYFPGFSVNQGVRLRIMGQRQWMDGKRYYLSNLVSWPRGYSTSRSSEKYLGCSLDYAIPVWLGDATIGNALYLKRLVMIPFADWAFNKNHEGTERLFSVGTDLTFEFHALKIGSPIKAGIRMVRRSTGYTFCEMLFDIVIQ